MYQCREIRIFVLKSKIKYTAEARRSLSCLSVCPLEIISEQTDLFS
jgi:hypothetical protein